MYTNADQLTNKLTEFNIRIDQVKPDIIGVTEVKPKYCRFKPNIAEFSLDGYYTLGKNIENNIGRGMLIYIKNSLKCDIVDMKTNFEENLFVEIKINNKDKLLLGLIYRSDSGSRENNNQLCNLFGEATTLGYSHLMVMGDFNYPDINWETYNSKGDSTETKEYKFVECIQENYLFQHVKKPTRWRGGDTPNVLDLVITNEENMITNMDLQSPLGKSDHCVLVMDFNCYTIMKSKKRTVVMYNKANYGAINEDIRNTDWNAVLLNTNPIDENWDIFYNLIKDIESKHIPTKTVNNNRKVKGFIPLDNATQDIIKRKHSLAKKAIANKDPLVQKEYRRARNQAKKATRKLRKKFERDLSLKAKENPKAIWKYIKSKSKTKVRIGDLYTDQTDRTSPKTSSDKDKANILAEFFKSVFVEEDGNIPAMEVKDMTSEMEDMVINEQQVVKVLQKLKKDKSPGLDNLHPRVLREISSSIASPLTLLFNQSLQQGTAPEAWKKAQITAIYKKGDKSEAGNYRPVSLTSIICKTMETLVRDHIVSYMRQNDMFTPQQFGFLAGRSISLQMLEVLDKWTEALDTGRSIDCIYLDFKKAFDTVPHNRLLSKLKAYKFSNQILNWINSFLNNRMQRVTVNGEHSEWTRVSSGIPQGSVLGPILFVMFVNDLPDSVNSCMFLFADDTKIFRIIENEEDKAILQKDLQSMEEWSKRWLLQVHPQKCKHMRIGTMDKEESTSYTINNQELIQTNKEKDIGITVDHKLTFEDHLSEKVNKANSMFAMLRRTFEYMNKQTFIPLYKSLVRIHLDFASSVWSPYKMKDIEKLESVQRRSTKQLPGMKDISYPERLVKLNLPTLAYRRIRGDMIEAYKIISGIYDQDTNSILKPWNSAAAKNSSRGNSRKIFPERSRTNVRKNFFSQRVVNVWNNLPENIVSAPNINTFKNRLDKHWASQELVYNYKASII